MIQVLDRAMRIMEMMGANHQKEYTSSEIAKALSIDKGTCNRILKTLVTRGFVQQQSCRGGYQIGYKLYHLIGKQVENSDLVLKQNTFFIENAHKNAIFVHIKSTYCPHRL